MKNLTLYSTLLFTVIFSLISCSKEEPFGQEITGESDPQYAAGGIFSKKAPKFNTMFNTYGNGWTGADATYSIPLPDGRTVWLFGDSFLDTVYADYSRPGSDLVRNTFVVQTGTSLTTLVTNTIDDPEAFVSTPDPVNEWYWPGDGTVIGETLYVYMEYFIKTGGGIFDFHYVRTDLVAFSLPDLTEISRTPAFEDENIIWGASLMEDGSYIYVYGAEETAFTKYSHVARIPAGNIYGTKEFWNGSTWTTTEPASNFGRLEKQSGLALDVSAQYAVFYHAGKYRLVTQEGFLGPTIYTWESTSPKGPWKARQTVYVTPETGGDLFTYNAFVHPQFVLADGSLLLSYNENSFNFFDLFEDARIYRPKFVWFKYL